MSAMSCGWQNNRQSRPCNHLQNVGATTYKNILQFYAKKACKKQNGSKSIHCKNCEAKKNVTVIQATGSDEKVVKKNQKITTVKLKTYKAKSLKRKKVVFSLKAKTSGNGKLTYKVTKGKSKYITVSKTGKVTLKKGCKKGTYKITITASATEKYKAATKVISIKVK